MPRKSTNSGTEESPNTPVLIKAYGEFWSPDVVTWGRKWRLMGTRSDSKTNINVYEQRGVYVLYNDFEPVYVGKADKNSIGWRLEKHRESQRMGPRWNRFSWFGIRGIRKNGKLGASNRSAHSRATELIATLEALLITVIDPRLNSRREKLRNAILFHQSEVDKPIEPAERLSAIEEKLDLVLKLEKETKPRVRNSKRAY
jgi:hypothetical protein